MNQLQSTYNKLNGSQITQKNTCNVQKASSARKPTVSTLQVIKFESHKLKSNRSKRKEQYKHGVLWNFQCTQNSEFTRVRKMPNISVFYLSNIDIHHIKLNNWKLMNTKNTRATNLIKEDCAWQARATEQCPNCQFTFSNMLIQKFRTLTNHGTGHH
jgi:hypothetical protein